MRYNSKERLGVNTTEQIFLRDFDWIFREQPLVDVGIDALVEQADQGKPLGKFLALQIKSGTGNFHISTEKLTYYISNVHYNYWTSFDLPVILIAHIPSENLTYWEELSVKKIKKADKRWKLEIPRQNLLNQKAKPYLSKLLSHENVESKTLKIFQGQEIESTTVFELDSKIDCIADAGESTAKIVQILEDLTTKINASGEKFKLHNLRGDPINSFQVKNSVKTFAKNINISTRRLENEILIFSETFAEGLYAYEQAVLLHFGITKELIDLKDHLKSFEFLSPAIDSAILGIQEMKEGFDGIPAKYPELKIVRRSSLKVIDLMIEEYRTAKEMTENAVQQISSKLV